MTSRLSPVTRQVPFDPFIAWIDLILLATHTDHVCGEVPLRKGQVLTSQESLGERWHWDRKKVRNFLKSCQKWGEIEFETTTKWTLITICNYDKYRQSSTSTPQQLPTINNGNNGKGKAVGSKNEKRQEDVTYPLELDDYQIQKSLKEKNDGKRSA